MIHVLQNFRLLFTFYTSYVSKKVFEILNIENIHNSAASMMGASRDRTISKSDHAIEVK